MVPSCWPVAKRVNNRHRNKGLFLHQPFRQPTLPSYHRGKNHDTETPCWTSRGPTFLRRLSRPDTLALGLNVRETICNSVSFPVVSRSSMTRSRVRNIVCRVLFPAEPTLLGVRPGSRTRDAHFGQLSTRTQYLGECQDAMASLRFAMVILALSVSSCV